MGLNVPTHCLWKGGRYFLQLSSATLNFLPSSEKTVKNKYYHRSDGYSRCQENADDKQVILEKARYNILSSVLEEKNVRLTSDCSKG